MTDQTSSAAAIPNNRMMNASSQRAVLVSDVVRSSFDL